MLFEVGAGGKKIALIPMKINDLWAAQTRDENFEFAQKISKKGVVISNYFQEISNYFQEISNYFQRISNSAVETALAILYNLK